MGYLSSNGVHAGLGEVHQPYHNLQHVSNYLSFHTHMTHRSETALIVSLFLNGAHNPLPAPEHMRHKMHMDQNEKLDMFGVTHVVAVAARPGSNIGLMPFVPLFRQMPGSFEGCRCKILTWVIVTCCLFLALLVPPAAAGDMLAVAVCSTALWR